MSSFSSLIFTRPKVLHSANRSVLRSFLDPYRDFLTARGVDFEELANPENGDAFNPLIQTFLSPQADTPAELIDAVFCVSELATPDAVDVLANAAQNLGVKLPANATPAEIAMLLYMASPDVAQALHYERLPLRARAFEYFSTESVTAPVFEPPITETIQALERSLNIWFEKRRMGCGCRIFNYTRDHETWFLIRHGDYYRREATVADDGGAASVQFRPEKFDVLVYDSLSDEIRINARTPAIRDRYRTTFSVELFGRENHFPNTHKYSLDPIRRDGSACVECVDVPGLVWIRLVKIEYELPELEREVRSHKAEDMFNAMACRQFELKPNARLLQATFKVRFRDNPLPRSVTIKPTNVALYTRDDDSQLIEEWLMRRGFTERRMVFGYEQQEFLLEMS